MTSEILVGNGQGRSASPGGAGRRRSWEPLALRLLGIAVALVVWQLVTSSRVLGLQFGPAFSPLSTLVALFGMVERGEVLRHLLPSLQRVAVGLVIATAVGMPVGVLVGYYRRLEWATTTVFQFIRMISPLSWMPIAIIAFGVGDRPVYFLIAATAVWPIIINTAHGVNSMDPVWLKVARNLGAGEMLILRRVVVPAVLGDFLTGLRVAIGWSWVVLVPAEMLGVASGLGYYILDTRDRFRYDELMAVVILIGFVGFALDWSARKLKGRFAWRDAILV
jgi:NitT/TauT family transport system permease protein